MGKTSIEWTEQTWNPIGGCRKVSPGCKNCYAIRQARRMQGSPIVKIRTRYQGLTVEGPNWSGATFIDEEVLREPLKTRKPTTYFISLSDLFYDERPDEDIDRVFAVMALAHWHKFLILTKYQERMRDVMTNVIRTQKFWPIPNVGLGVSVEDRQRMERIDTLRETPAAMRFLSLEPLLEDLGTPDLRRIDWVIVGGESGPRARPVDPAWVRSLRDQCQSAGVPFFFKQWGEYLPPMEDGALIDGVQVLKASDDPQKVGKKKAGALLDRREWRALPAFLGGPAV